MHDTSEGLMVLPMVCMACSRRQTKPWEAWLMHLLLLLLQLLMGGLRIKRLLLSRAGRPCRGLHAAVRKGSLGRMVPRALTLMCPAIIKLPAGNTKLPADAVLAAMIPPHVCPAAKAGIIQPKLRFCRGCS